jgi:hypothetical protein
MNKLLVLFAALGAVVAGQAQAAGSAASNFDVNVTLTSVCQVKTASTGMNFTYTAFQAGASTANTSVVFECTRGFTNPPTVVLDTGTGATSAAAGQGTTGAGVVGGLQYTLTVAAGSKTTTGTAATTGSIGSADQYTFAISGNMASGQAGDSSLATTQTRTLTLAY